MAPKPLKQEEIYYQEPWSIFTETICLAEMDAEVREGRWLVGAVEHIPPKMISDFHKKLIDDPYYLQITLAQLVDKLFEWQGRYRRFKNLVEDDRVDYDRDTGKVTATPDVWSELELECSLNLCYMEKGELNWPLMRLLFEEPDSSSDNDDGGASSSNAMAFLSRTRWGPSITHSGSSNIDGGHPGSPEI